VQFGTEFIAKTEGDSGQTAFTFEITRRGLLTEEVTVDVRAEGSGAHPTDAADANLVPFSQLTFARDETSKIYTVLVNRDTLQEPDETFTLTLAPAPFSFPQIANGTATGVILNDDAPPPPSGGSGQVYTSAGAETITGASGDDTINASRGFDVLTGAGGADQFVFGAEPWAPIEITDFTPGADKLDFRLIFDTLGYSGSDPFGDGYISLVDDGAGGAVVLFDRDLSGPDPEWPTYIVHLKDVVAAHLGLGDWIVQ
jgi:hypothetical protein